MKWWLIWLLVLPLRPATPPLKVRLPEGLVEMPLERYVAAVLAGESSVFRSDEALKAMAVAARTYAIRLRGRHSAEGYDFCSTTHCQHLEPKGVSARLESAAADTTGELLWYEGKPVFACYTRDCGGRTEDAGAVWPELAAPCLKSHDDPYCGRAGAAAWRWSGDPQKIADVLRRAQLKTPSRVEQVAIVERTASGRARTLALSGGGQTVRIAAGSFRFAIGRDIGWNTILSDRYEVHGAVFAGLGSGHGVGLCQRGADQMGLAGRSYREILAFYYPGTAVGLSGRGISWQRISGELLALMTTRPDQDAAVLALAEGQLRAVSQRLNQPPPSGIEVRVYPDLDAFRNATGEPGWVAAHTAGRRIHLQPASILRNKGALEKTLRHELLHVVVESQAKPGLPVWFREGLAGYLEGEPAEGATGRPPPDADLRQTDDAAKARRAYKEAIGAVALLVRKHGEPAVLQWLRAGLPAGI